MKLFVELFTGNTITLEVEATDTINNVIAKIQDMEDVGVPVEFQILTLPLDRYEECVGHKTLSDYNIKDEDTVMLVYRGGIELPNFSDGSSDEAGNEIHEVSDKMQIFVNTLDGKTITLDMKTDNIIQDIKTMIHQLEAVPVHQQVLSFNDRVIDDSWEKQLGYYGLKDGDELNLTVVMNPLFELCCHVFPDDFEFTVTAHARMDMWTLQHAIYSKLKDDDRFKHFRPKMQKLHHCHFDDEEEEECTDEIEGPSVTLEELGINENSSQEVSDHTDELVHRIAVMYDDSLEDSEATDDEEEEQEEENSD